MTEPVAHASVELPRPAMVAVRRAVRLTVVTMAGVMVAGGLALMALDFESFPVAQAVGVVVATALYVAALMVHNEEGKISLIFAALACQVAPIVVTTGDSDARTSASVSLFLMSFFCVVALPRWRALAAICGIVALWVVIVPANALLVPVLGQTVNARWFTLPQLVISALWLWWIWQRQLALIEHSDNADQAAQLSLLVSRSVQERVRVWRRSAVRIHETVLNDIRYVLTTDRIDGSRLLEQLVGNHTAVVPLDDGQVAVSEVISQASSVEPAIVLSVHGREPTEDLPSSTGEVLRALLVEVLRNAVRHAQARTAHIDVRVDPDSITLLVEHDGDLTAPPEVSGVGLQVALHDTAASAGGSVTLGARSVVIQLPTKPPKLRVRPPTRLKTGQVVLGTAMAGNAVGGSLFASLLIAEGGRATWAGLGALVAASLAASAVIRRRVTAVTLSWVAGLALAVPVLLASPQQCNVAGVSAIVVVLTVFALAALIVWVPALPQLLASSFGVAGLAVFLVGAQPECHPQVQSALVAACAVPVVFVIVRVSVRLSELRAEQQIRMEVSRALEESAAQAERDAALQLQDSVTEATKLMKNIAAIGVATPADRRELRRLDGLIRASIQVDPKTAGGFASAALQVAQLAADNGKSVRVLTIKDSGDPRPLPGPVVRAAEALVLGSPEGAATVQALSAPGEDSLLISAPLVALSEAGLHPGWAVAIDDCRAELEVEPATATAVLIALRAVSISAH